MNKVYIVLDKEQELKVLKKLEQEGFKWHSSGKLPTKFILSSNKISNPNFTGFPYTIIVDEDNTILWSNGLDGYEGDIVYDGRKENKMKRYLVTQEFMNELIEWRDNKSIDVTSNKVCSYLDGKDLDDLPFVVDEWWRDDTESIERNNRLIAILRWLNGEDVFETQKTYKYYIARTSSPVMYFSMKKWYHSEFPKYDTISSEKKIFDTREEAEKWLVPGYEVVEIDENEL